MPDHHNRTLVVCQKYESEHTARLFKDDDVATRWQANPTP